MAATTSASAQEPDPTAESPDEPAARSKWSRHAATLRSFLSEAILIALLLSVYQGVRHLAIGHFAIASQHAHWVWDLERGLHLPNEAKMQDWALQWSETARLTNLYYVSIHFPGTAVALAWLFLRHRAVYLRTRTELVLLTSAGLVVHVLFPLAPPRLMASFGMVDTMLSVGPSAYPSSGADSGFANQYAAMPSLHVGWAVLVAIGVLRASRSRWRWLIVAHPLLTFAVVLLTANHYWLDGIVATLLLAMAILLVRLIYGRNREPGLRLAPPAALRSSARQWRQRLRQRQPVDDDVGAMNPQD